MKETEDKSSDLPDGWAWAKLNDVCLDSQYGWTTSAALDGNLHLLRTTDITSGNVDWNNVPFCKEEPSDAEKYLLKDGDIVISRAGSVGHSYLIKNPQRSIFASYLIRFKPLIDEKYLSYFLESPDYWQAISEKSLGIAVPNVNASKLRQIVVPISPLPEQHRIVARIEELFSRLDAGVEALQMAKVRLRHYRQSVLKAAMEGRLTEEWRKAHPEVEPAATLLRRIVTKRKEVNQFCFEAESILEPRELPNLPESWKWTRVGQIFDVYVGATPRRNKPEYWGGDIPWVSSGEVAFCRIHKTRESISQLGFENSSTKIHPPGTVLLGMIGEGKTRGQAAILEIAACNNQNSAAIRVSEVGLAPEYLYYYLEHEYERTRKIKFRQQSTCIE